MHIFGQLILGLGLFFLGMRQVADNLRRLSGPSFRSMMARTTGSPLEAGMLGLMFGMLMQSATAVTFILVSMVSSGLITCRAALPVIAWTNVGLTALAFIVTLSIQPLVAYLVGLSAVLASLVRKPTGQALAGVVLGIGLIFFGLQTMGSAAQPLVTAPWFQGLLRQTVGSPAIAFLVGIAVATVLQSNTASTLLIITLAGAGAFDLEPALMLIYGTNLGAIGLRMLLAADLRGTSLQLVHFEDLFCLVSGVLMVILYYVEKLLGVPLIRAGIAAVSPDLKTQLALAFLLSNLLPAMLLSGVLGKSQALLARLWPATAEEDEAKPKFITTQSLADPDTALDLLERETVRLLQGVRNLLTSKGLVADEAAHVAALGELARSIDAFATQLDARPLSFATARRLNTLREALAFVNYLKEITHQLGQLLGQLFAHPASQPAADRVLKAAGQLLDEAIGAAAKLAPADIDKLREDTRRHGPFLDAAQKPCMEEAEKLDATTRLTLLHTLEDLRMVGWMLHRFAKLLSDQAPQQAEA